MKVERGLAEEIRAAQEEVSAEDYAKGGGAEEAVVFAFRVAAQRGPRESGLLPPGKPFQDPRSRRSRGLTSCRRPAGLSSGSFGPFL